MILPTTYTVEIVAAGHPDKVCDQISDAILDAYLKKDPQSRVAAETFGSPGLLVVAGEVTSKAKVDHERIARSVYRAIGYHEPIKIVTNINRQSPDIAQGVNTGGAGDQGIMYGYATDETPEYLPRAVVLAHALARRISDQVKNKKGLRLGPDGKTQVTIHDNKIESVLVSVQHDPRATHEEVTEAVIKRIIKPVIGNLGKINVLVNPTGKFSVGGFVADTGLTGRKIMVDTYGGLIPHGGGAFSGKDPTKVDRSAAYMCRFVAKNIVASGKAKQCLVSVAYAIGKVDPLMVHAVDQNGKDISKLAQAYDFRPQSIIAQLNLRRPIYAETAAFGHFGQSGRSWEKIVKKA